MKKTLFLNVLAFMLICFMSSCVKEKFDEPPTGGKDPDIAVNMTLAELKTRYSGSNYQITDDLVISAIVSADDKTGNFYKNIIIQDSTAGITLLLDATSLYTSYPIGRRIFIKLKGMYLVQYRGLYQLAHSVAPDGSFNGIPSTLLDNYILKGSYPHPVAPKVVSSIADLNDTYQSTLIELDDVEFQDADAGQPYADAVAKGSLNRTIKDCGGGSIVTFNSGYATFASALTPTKHGKLVAIYSVYNSKGQLLLRDPETDIQMDTTRCDGSGGGGGGGGKEATTTIAAIRSLYNGSADVTIPADQVIVGTVISDDAGGNIGSGKSLYIQDSTSGTNIFFSANHKLALGDKVSVDLSGGTITTYKGNIEITNVAISAIGKIGTGTVTPRVATIADITTNMQEWQSTLVKVTGATADGTDFGTTKNISVGSDKILFYTSSFAKFKTTPISAGTHSFTGYVVIFNGSAEIVPRNASDVQ